MKILRDGVCLRFRIQLIFVRSAALLRANFRVTHAGDYPWSCFHLDILFSDSIHSAVEFSGLKLSAARRWWHMAERPTWSHVATLHEVRRKYRCIWRRKATLAPYSSKTNVYKQMFDSSVQWNESHLKLETIFGFAVAANKIRHQFFFVCMRAWTEVYN